MTWCVATVDYCTCTYHDNEWKNSWNVVQNNMWRFLHLLSRRFTYSVMSFRKKKVKIRIEKSISAGEGSFCVQWLVMRTITFLHITCICIQVVLNNITSCDIHNQSHNQNHWMDLLGVQSEALLDHLAKLFIIYKYYLYRLITFSYNIICSILEYWYCYYLFKCVNYKIPKNIQTTKN